MLSLAVPAHAQAPADGASPPAGDAGVSLPGDAAAPPPAAAAPEAPVTEDTKVFVDPEAVNDPAAAPAVTPGQSALPTILRPRRAKPLRGSLGGQDVDIDLGSDVDTLLPSGGPEAAGLDFRLAGWTFNIQAFIRMPLRLGFGPRDDGLPGTQMHAPPRLVGASSTEWNHIPLSPSPNSGFVLTGGTRNVGATIGFVANSSTSASWPDLTATQGSLTTGFLWLRFPEAFGTRGGLTMSAGNFGSRYGLAGRGRASSGYYGTYLFGRITSTGLQATADVDLTRRVELLTEAGIGAKTDVVPFFSGFYTKALPLPPTQKSGSNFIYHGHASLMFDNWFRWGLHYIEAWSDNDSVGLVRGAPAPHPRLRVYGSDVHIDDSRFGNAYLGYSRVVGENLDNPLEGTLEVIHDRGSGIAGQYFLNPNNPAIIYPAGSIDTLLFQYTFYPANFASGGGGGFFRSHPLMVGLRTMYSHVNSPGPPPVSANFPANPDVHQDKLKFGIDLQFDVTGWLVSGLLFDHVRPDLSKGSSNVVDWLFPGASHPENPLAFSAISPRLTFRTGRRSKEYIVLSYTHFFMNPDLVPSPRTRAGGADTDLLMLVLYMRL